MHWRELVMRSFRRKSSELTRSFWKQGERLDGKTHPPTPDMGTAHRPTGQNKKAVDLPKFDGPMLCGCWSYAEHDEKVKYGTLRKFTDMSGKSEYRRVKHAAH